MKKCEKYEEGEVIRRRRGKEMEGEIKIYVGVMGAEVSRISHFIKDLAILEYLNEKRKRKSSSGSIA